MPTPQHHLFKVADFFSTTSEKINATLAAGAIATPLWRQYLKSVSDDATIVAPILGCLWIVVQITAKIIEIRRKAKDRG